jgi:hypothetical protein
MSKLRGLRCTYHDVGLALNVEPENEEQVEIDDTKEIQIVEITPRYNALAAGKRWAPVRASYAACRKRWSRLRRVVELVVLGASKPQHCAALEGAPPIRRMLSSPIGNNATLTRAHGPLPEPSRSPAHAVAHSPRLSI